MLPRLPSKHAQVALLLFSGCLASDLQAETSSDTRLQGGRFHHDQVTAYIPSQNASIPSVALAQLNIALHIAKTRTEQTLCGSQWTPRGDILQQTGPYPAPDSATDEKAWYYISLRQAHPLACKDVSRARFFLEMSRHLPAWIAIRPAGQLTAFRQGKAQVSRPSSVAAR